MCEYPCLMDGTDGCAREVGGYEGFDEEETEERWEGRRGGGGGTGKEG